MAQVANTYETFDAVGIREELANTISNISPEETPFLSLIGRKSIKTTHPEWQLDSNATPDVDNNQPEGNDWTYDAVTPTSRVGNYAQISTKPIIVSGTLMETDTAGRADELAYQVAKKGVELKTDQEVILLSNQASSAGSGNAATNRKLGGMRAWVATNDNIGGGGSSGGFNSSTNVVDAATNGSQRAFTKALLDETILSTYNAGGNPTVFMCSPYVKTVFSTILDDANVVPLRKDVKSGQATIVAAADMYQSDFGLISVVPNRQMARAGATVARNAFLLTPSKAKLGTFRDYRMEKPAKTGDAEKRVLLTEYTLIVENEAAHGCIADLYGINSGS